MRVPGAMLPGSASHLSSQAARRRSGTLARSGAMLAGSWLGSLPATTWHFTHCQRPKRSRPAASTAGSITGFGS